MSCDRVKIINNPCGVLEKEACTLFHRPLLIGASPRPLLLRWGKGRRRPDPPPPPNTSYQWSHLVWVIILNALLNLQWPWLQSNRTHPAPHPPFISKVILSLTTSLIELPYWYALLFTREQIFFSDCWWVEWYRSWPPKPGKEWESSLWFLPQMCVLLHKLDSLIILLCFSQPPTRHTSLNHQVWSRCSPLVLIYLITTKFNWNFEKSYQVWKCDLKTSIQRWFCNDTWTMWVWGRQECVNQWAIRRRL